MLQETSQTSTQKSINTRRSFLKGALSAAAVVTTASTGTVLTSSHAPAKPPMTGIVYTKENPGKWAKKVGSHLPAITIDGNKVTVETNHGMSNKHFIVRHTLGSHNGEVLGEKTFTPDDENALSSYTLPEGYKGKLYASSFCNKHDFWLAETNV